MGDPTDGEYYILCVSDPGFDIAWTIQQAAGQDNPEVMNIISARGDLLKPNGPFNGNPLWNRVDPDD